MSRKFALAFALCTMFGAMAAAPASAAETVSVHVQYADLNLNSPRGAQRMLSRIDNAAGVVCGDTRGIMTLSERMQIRTCRQDIKTRAVDTLNHPTVSAMFYGHEPNIILASR